MQESLLRHYQRELSVLGELGKEFARTYPRIASRLALDTGDTPDPHIERLIQAASFLAARIQLKLEDEFPEITMALLNNLYPHYLAPIPSMAIGQFVLDPEQGKLTTGYRIDRETTVYSRPVNDMQCRFRTCYPITLWPIKLQSAQFEVPDHPTAGFKALDMIRLKLQCLPGINFNDLALDRLRFYLHGDSQTVYPLYELLFNHLTHVQIRNGGATRAVKPLTLSPQSVQQVGFGVDEGMLPYSTRSFLGYRLLQEYFVFPEKFLFFDLDFELKALGPLGDQIDVLFFFDRPSQLEHSVKTETFQLGCAPLINLFEQITEPIRWDQTQTEYRVIPDVRRQNGMEIYSIESVIGSSPDSEKALEIQPFYSFKHSGGEGVKEAFWYASRKPPEKKDDPGTEVYLSIVDLNYRPADPPAETVVIRATCSNRDLPAKLSFTGEQGDLELEGAPLSSIRCLTKPSRVRRPPLKGATQWRLISHLSLNHLSICEGGKEALQEILKLYDFSESPGILQQINGIARISNRRIVGRPAANTWNGFCRGLEVTIEFDEDKYVGSGVFLFASVLEKFLGLYVSINSFVQLVARTRQREEAIKRWPPRAGEQILL